MGTVVEVDSCDFGVRTYYDEYNETVRGPAPVVSRYVQKYDNTQYIQVGNDVVGEVYNFGEYAYLPHE